MATLADKPLPKSAGTKPLEHLASALAGKPIPLHRTSVFDLVVEKPILSPTKVLPFLTGYKQPHQDEISRALRGQPGTKVGTVISGTTATNTLLAAREVNGDLTLRFTDPETPVGEMLEPDLRLASVTMMGCDRFTESDAWLVCELAGYDETPEELTERITGLSWRIVNVIEHVPLPVAAATKNLLTSKGFSNLTVRQAVPRTN